MPASNIELGVQYVTTILAKLMGQLVSYAITISKGDTKRDELEARCDHRTTNNQQNGKTVNQ